MASRYPAGIPYIIGNEGCERFSYYGMRALLWLHMVSMLAPRLGEEAAKSEATARTHLFFAGAYAFPMVGAIIADRLLGKYRTIFWLSLVYCAGQAALAMFGTGEVGLGVGLALVALGTGGIKSCVSAQVGDQFTEANKDLLPKIYQLFYFMINFGSFFAQLLTPWLYKKYGSGVAFGVPGVLMAIATVVMWAGRDKFVRVPPQPGGELGLLDTIASIALFGSLGSLFFTASSPLWVQLLVGGGCLAVWALVFTMRQRKQRDHGFLTVMVESARRWRPGRAFFTEDAEGPKAVLRILSVFVLVSVFWSLFDQKASSFVNQAAQLNRDFELPLIGAIHFEPAQLSALNPMLVMIIIPLLNFVVYPILEKLGVTLTPLRKMSAGMFLAVAAFARLAMLQGEIEAAPPQSINVLWQFFPYLLLTTAEVLVSATGLEFAYTQAPPAMKSTVNGFWQLTVTLGNILVALMSHFLRGLALHEFFWVFTGLMLVAAIGFAARAYFYKGKSYILAEMASE